MLLASVNSMNCLSKSGHASTGVVVNAVLSRSNAVCSSVLHIHRAFFCVNLISGAATVAKFGTNRRYHDAICLTFLGCQSPGDRLYFLWVGSDSGLLDNMPQVFNPIDAKSAFLLTETQPCFPEAAENLA